MALKSIISNSKLNALAQAIASKAGATLPLTVDQMTAAVSGMTPGGGGPTIDDLFNKSITSYSSSSVTTIPSSAFSQCTHLTSVQLTAAGNLNIMDYAFSYCTALVSLICNTFSQVSLQSNALMRCTGLQQLEGPFSYFGSSACNQCAGLTKVRSTYQPSAALAPTTYTTVQYSAFYSCNNLKVIDFANAPDIKASSAFGYCPNFDTLVIRDTGKVGVLAASGLSEATKFANGTASIFVCDNLVNTYKSSTNWSALSAMIKPLSEYVEAA